MKRIFILVSATITLSVMLQTAQAINPQPEPPGKDKRSNIIIPRKVLPAPGQVFKLQNGKQGIILNNRLFILQSAQGGEHTLGDGSKINVNEHGIIIISN